MQNSSKFSKWILTLLVTISVTVSAHFAHAQQSCLQLLTGVPSAATSEKALNIMLEGSLNVSRTKAIGRRYIAPKEVEDNQIAAIAEINFKRAANYMLKNKDTLEINLQTATDLNRMLTENLVPEKIRGYYNYRRNGPYVDRTDSFVGGDPVNFYKWLDSAEAKSMAKNDPIALAEIVHNSIAALDSFPDGNGRLSRLLADLVLLKSGLMPAFYTDMKDYFDRGNARSDVSREIRIAYFREIVLRGQLAN